MPNTAQGCKQIYFSRKVAETQRSRKGNSKKTLCDFFAALREIFLKIFVD